MASAVVQVPTTALTGVNGLNSAPVSVLVATLNEVENLAECLSSVSFASEIIVVDSGSEDGTIEIASDAGAQVVRYPRSEIMQRRKRTWALEELEFRNEWVLVLDADERVSPELRDEITSLVVGGARHAAYFIPFEMYFLGRWIRHCGWYPSYQLRLFRRGAARYESPHLPWSEDMGDVEVHERLQPLSSAGKLQGHLKHFDYRGLSNWIAKHNRYSTWEAVRRQEAVDHTTLSSLIRQILRPDPAFPRRGLRLVAQHVPARPLLTFIWMYIFKRGFLDGRAGLTFCILHALHQFHIDIKAREISEARTFHVGP